MGKYHASQLVPALKFFGAVVSLVFIDDALELVPWEQVQELREDVWRAGHIYFLIVNFVDKRMTRMLSGIILVGSEIITVAAFDQHSAQCLHFESNL
jgi:hypothetical protein